MSKKWRIGLAVLAILSGIVWVLYPYLPPARTPDRVGLVESVTTSDRGEVEIRLRFAEPPPADPAHTEDKWREQIRLQDGIVYIRLPANATIRRGWFQTGEVRAGQRVRVWCEGFMMTSYPPQQVGTRVQIDSEP